jgi:hypothetical protein
MLRINRNNLPSLPYPVFEIQAEHTVAGDILISVMAGQGANLRCEVFSLMERAQLEQGLSHWLRGLPLFEPEFRDWEIVSTQAATRVGQWANDKPMPLALTEKAVNDILQMAIEKLSIASNVSTGLAHPLDESRAKELFIALRNCNVLLSKEDVCRHAQAYGWPARQH